MNYNGSEYAWPHRTYCTVLEELRSQIKVLDANNAYVVSSISMSLIEELQTIGNRMEAGLDYKRDIETLHKKRKELNKEVEALKEKVPRDD